jgi:hypothetical protein
MNSYLSFSKPIIGHRAVQAACVPVAGGGGLPAPGRKGGEAAQAAFVRVAGGFTLRCPARTHGSFILRSAIYTYVSVVTTVFRRVSFCRWCAVPSQP